MTSEHAARSPWTRGPVTLHTGDALRILTTMPDASVDCIVTSPPYWGLRDYGTGHWTGGQTDCAHDGAPSLAAARRADQQRRCPTCDAVWGDQQHGLETTLAEYLHRLVTVFGEAKRVLHPTGTLWLNLGDNFSRHAKEGAPEKSLVLAPERRALALIGPGLVVATGGLAAANRRTTTRRRPQRVR